MLYKERLLSVLIKGQARCNVPLNIVIQPKVWNLNDLLKDEGSSGNSQEKPSQASKHRFVK